MDNIIITPAQNSLRSIAMIAGVLIAIICALVSLNRTNSSEVAEASVEHSIDMNAFATPVITKAVSLVGHSVMVITKD